MALIAPEDQSPVTTNPADVTAGQGINESSPGAPNDTNPSTQPAGRSIFNPSGPQLVRPGAPNDANPNTATPIFGTPSGSAPNDAPSDTPVNTAPQPIVQPPVGGGSSIDTSSLPAGADTGNLSGIVSSLGGLLGGSDSSTGGDASTPQVSTTEVPVTTATTTSGGMIWIVLGVLALGGLGYFGYKKGWFGKHGAAHA